MKVNTQPPPIILIQAKGTLIQKAYFTLSDLHYEVFDNREHLELKVYLRVSEILVNRVMAEVGKKLLCYWGLSDSVYYTIFYVKK